MEESFDQSGNSLKEEENPFFSDKRSSYGKLFGYRGVTGEGENN